MQPSTQGDGHPPQGQGRPGHRSALLRSALEALESLLSTAGHWRGFAHLGMHGA